MESNLLYSNDKELKNETAHTKTREWLKQKSLIVISANK